MEASTQPPPVDETLGTQRLSKLLKQPSTGSPPARPSARNNETATAADAVASAQRSANLRRLIAPVFRSKPQQAPPLQPKQASSRQSRYKGGYCGTHELHEGALVSDSDASSDEYHLHKVGVRSADPIEIEVSVNGRDLSMEVDTGVAMSVILEATKKSLFPDLQYTART